MEVGFLLFLVVSCGSVHAKKADSATPAHFLSDAYIEKINSEQNLWKAGRNFDPQTPLHDIKILLGTRMDQKEKFLVGNNDIEGNYDKNSSFADNSDAAWLQKVKIPKNFDARKKWGQKCPTIGEVLDQGKCGSCWAVAAVQAFTDRYCIATGGRHKKRLSLGEVLACCFDCGFGCKGGWEIDAWDYFFIHGLPSGGLYNSSIGCYPYPIQSPCHYHDDNSPYQECALVKKSPDCRASCTNPSYKKKIDKDLKFAKQVYRIPPHEVAIQKEILLRGPITIAFLVRTDFLNYKSGVYEPSPDALALGGHAVKLIGWGVEKGIPYWLVMNSWNPYWGAKGLIKIKRGCSITRLEWRAFAALPDVLRHV